MPESSLTRARARFKDQTERPTPRKTRPIQSQDTLEGWRLPVRVLPEPIGKGGKGE